MQFLRLLFHLAPIGAFALHRPYLGVALVLLVLLCYVKIQKFDAELRHIEQNGGKGSAQYLDLLKVRQRWHQVTFLRGEA